MNLGTAFRLAAKRFPDVPAIVTGNSKMSYGQWGERVRAVALKLAVSGIERGDRVAICAVNGEMPATVFFAVHALGAVAVMINTRWKSADIEFALQDSNSKAIFYDTPIREEIQKLTHQIEKDFLLVADVPESERQAGELAYARFAEPMTGELPSLPHCLKGTGTILYTSGTTGRPKGVCRSPESDYYAALAIILEHRWERFERILAVMPLYHTMGLHTLISQVLLNATAVVPAHPKQANYLELIKAGEVSALYLVPTMYHDLVEQAAGCLLTPVRKLAFAGAPMYVNLQEACRELFTPDIFINQYGCTEMIAISINDRLRQKPLSVGRPALQSRVLIVRMNECNQQIESGAVRTGEIGEILVDASLPQTFLGYLGNREATERVLHDGWYCTGDMGFLDEDGDLYLTGRVDDMIISGGENIFPHEVEEILLQCPGVREAVVVGAPDIRWGQRVVAFVVTEDGSLSELQLEAFCIHHPKLARFKRPREFVLLREIPKSQTGKVLRSSLRCMVQK